MVIGLHEGLSGHASRVRVLDRVLARLREREDVWWARKDEIARWVLEHGDTAPGSTASPPRSADSQDPAVSTRQAQHDSASHRFPRTETWNMLTTQELDAFLERLGCLDADAVADPFAGDSMPFPSWS